MPGSSSIELPPPPDISKTLRYFRANGMFCDVRLRLAPESASSASFLAHRVVLAAASPFFCDVKKEEIVQELTMPPDMTG